MLIDKGDYADNFGRFGHSLQT